MVGRECSTSPWMLGRTVVVPPGPSSSPLLSSPSTQLMRLARSASSAAPSMATVMPLLLAENRAPALFESTAPFAQPRQVYTSRVARVVAYFERSFWPTAPFSTTSPSGVSLALGGVPLGLIFQKSLAVVQ